MDGTGFVRLSRVGWVVPILGLCFCCASAAAAPTDQFERYEDGSKDFENVEIGDMLVYFHQRTIGAATVEKDYIVYQLDKDTGELLARKSHWRDDLPATLPRGLISREQAEALVEGDIQFSSLIIISPESDVFPFDPTPKNPCWVVRSIGEHGEYAVIVIDAVAGVLLGEGVPPPYTAFSMTGPQYENPCSGAWYWWSQNAESWFNTMGYSTEEVEWPTRAKIQSHVQSEETAMFYELAHGASNYFASGCVGNYHEYTYATDIEAWMVGYDKMPFAFIGSCAGMCSTGNNTFAYEFRKGSPANTTVVGYCGMSEPQCEVCWGYSLDWQDALFSYMNAGWTVRDAFDQANADYATCAGANNCMRFAGDESFAVVPVVWRWTDCNGNGVPDDDDIAMGTSQDCQPNNLPDECDVDGGYSEDCNDNGRPDECDVPLVVSDPPPADQNPCPGHQASFTVTANTSEFTTFSYQWMKGAQTLYNGGDISGATSATLTISNAEIADNGDYHCEVTADGCIEAASDSGNLTVIVAEIVEDPETGDPWSCMGDERWYSVVAGNMNPLLHDYLYQWFHDGEPLGPPTEGWNVLVLEDLAGDDAGSYACQVTSECGGDTVESEAAILKVVSGSITEQPKSLCVLNGQQAQFNVAAELDYVPEPGDPEIFLYGWEKWVDSEWSLVQYYDPPPHTIDPVVADDEGYYRTYAYTTGPGCKIYSEVVTLLVDDCPDCTSGADLDADGDVDLMDMAAFTLCFSPEQDYEDESTWLQATCWCTNLDDASNNVDTDDWSAFATEVTGP